MRAIGRRGDRRSGSGYAMAGLLVAIGVMGVLMSMAMPAWRTVTQREKEAELLFRGEQYLRAIDLYQRRFPGAYPTDLDMLVEQRFLRRQYSDPMTGEPFQILTQGSAAVALGDATASAEPGDGGQRNQRPDSTRRAGFGSIRPGLGSRSGGRTSPNPFSPARGGLGEEPGGIVGVVSRSSEESFREYNGATRYNEWLFVHVPQVSQPGGVGGAARGTGGGIDFGPGGRAGIGGGRAGVGGEAGRRDATGLFERPTPGGFGDAAGPGRGRGRARGR